MNCGAVNWWKAAKNILDNFHIVIYTYRVGLLKNHTYHLKRRIIPEIIALSTSNVSTNQRSFGSLHSMKFTTSNKGLIHHIETFQTFSLIFNECMRSNLNCFVLKKNHWMNSFGELTIFHDSNSFAYIDQALLSIEM